MLATVNLDNVFDSQDILTSSSEGTNASVIFDDVSTGTPTGSMDEILSLP